MRSAGVLAALLVSALVHPASTHAWCRQTTEDPPDGSVCATQGIPLWWNRRCSSYGFYEEWSKSMDPTDIRAAFQASFDTWTTVTCPDGHSPGFVVRQLDETTTCGHAATFRQGTNTHTVVFLQEWPGDYDPRAFAVTSTWHIPETGEILDVDIELNEERWTFERCPDTGCTNGHVDLQNVVTHEAGHYFGLGHSSVDGATMVYSVNNTNEVGKRTLEADDIEAICTTYPTGSLPAACDDSPWNGFAANLGCGDPIPKGCCSVVPGAPTEAPRVVAAFAALLLCIAMRRARQRPKTRQTRSGN